MLLIALQITLVSLIFLLGGIIALMAIETCRDLYGLAMEMIGDKQEAELEVPTEFKALGPARTDTGVPVASRASEYSTFYR